MVVYSICFIKGGINGSLFTESSLSRVQNLWMHSAVIVCLVHYYQLFLTDSCAIQHCGNHTHWHDICMWWWTYVCAHAEKIIPMSIITKHSVTHNALLVTTLWPQRDTDKVDTGFLWSHWFKAQNQPQWWICATHAKRDITSTNRWTLPTASDPQVFIV